MSLVWSLLQDDKRSQNVYDSAWLKEVPQLQPVRLLNHQCFQTEKTHALVHRGQSCLAVRFPEARNRKGTEGGPVHIGEKPVFCKQCNFSCTPAGSLKINMLIRVSHITPFFWIELRPFNHPCDWVIGVHKKNFSVIDSKLTFGDNLKKMAVLHSKNEAKICKICKMAVSP